MISNVCSPGSGGAPSTAPRCCRPPARRPMRSVSGNGSAGVIADRTADMTRASVGVLRGRQGSQQHQRTQHRAPTHAHRTPHSVAVQNSSSRLAATCARYSPVERMSSIGAISGRNAACASAIDAAARQHGRGVRGRARRWARPIRIPMRTSLPAHGGHHDLRDRLRAAGADLPPPLLAVDARNLDRGDHLVRPAHARAIAGVERLERHRARAGLAAQHDPRVRGGQHRQAYRPPATRWRRCRRACRDSGSARRRLPAPPRPASARASAPASTR